MPRVNVKDKRKQKLMEANIISIARRGLADTTIAHVSKGAGMSRGIVNFYFTSKEKMMQETLTHLAEEYTQTWKEALETKRGQSDEPLALIESLLRVLMDDRFCSLKRMAVWTAFLGHAGTHAGYARIVRAMDETLLRQLKDLWQKAGLDAKAAEQRARQIQALLRGHYFLSSLESDSKRPSFHADAWAQWLCGDAAPAAPTTDKVTKLKPVLASAKPKRPAAGALPGQLDFGDLFSR
jgi:AcrR family transcriptional regulator